MLVVEIISHTMNWYAGHHGCKFVVKLVKESDKYKVICPYQNSIKMPEQWYININNKLEYFLPKKDIKIIKKLPSNQTVKKIGYERLIVKTS